MSTFHMDGSDIQILDMRSPGQPVMELKGHHAQINAFGWGSVERPLLATAGMLILFHIHVHIYPSGSLKKS